MPFELLRQSDSGYIMVVRIEATPEKGNYTELLKSMRPDSIPRMAAFISIIRPGKAHLQNQPWDQVFESVWDGDGSRGFVFKQSHAISYAALVALHMNLINTPNQSN